MDDRAPEGQDPLDLLRDCRSIDSLGMSGRHRHGRFVFALRGADALDSAVFPLSRGVARVDDRRVISGIIFVIKNGLRWQTRKAFRQIEADVASILLIALPKRSPIAHGCNRHEVARLEI